MMQSLEDLEFTVLIAFVLENLLNGHRLPRFGYRGLEDDTEGAVPHDFLCVVGQTLK